MTIKPDLPTTGNRINPSAEIIAKALAYARGVSRDPDFRPFPLKQRAAICYPNQLYLGVKDIGRVGCLVGWHSSEERDFALNKRGLEHLFSAQQQGKIIVGVVALTANWSDVINVAPVQTVIDELQHHSPRNGPYGPYWWVDKDFDFAAQSAQTTHTAAAEDWF